MFRFIVNGKECQSEKDIRLIDYLRDELRLTSVKEGCSEGACGTCTIIVDGKKVKACVQKLSKMDGKCITTVEGLSSREKEVYAYCFAEAGAVQCGFCIPGMVISAKVLLDETLTPSREDVKKAIRGNICRCTGYQKIEDAILMAAEYFRENREIPQKEPDHLLVSERFPRVDAREKVMGTGQFVDDIVLPDMIYAKALRSRYPRARINKIDLSKAVMHPDCVAIYTAKDVPNNKHGHLKKDWDVMIAEGDITRYIGDALALVVSEHKETLDEILDLIQVDDTELPPVTSPRDALKEDAPKIHEGGNLLTKEVLKRGDADAAIAASKYVVSHVYQVPFTDHAFMEPECAIAFREGEKLHLYTASQSIYDEQHEIAHILNLPADSVISETKLVGGGFGGKEDMSVQHHAALAAWLTGRPVKVKFSREESIRCHVKRHAMEMEFTTACDENGCLTGMKAVIYSDTGAYASLGGPVLQRACTHAAGPYNYHDVDITGYGVYTNNIPAGAYRGFGVTQSCFATECNINELAKLAGITPWEIRYRNAIRPGQVLPNGQIASPDTALVETLEAVKEVYESSPYAGIASCMKNSGVGVGIPDTGRCNLEIRDGRVHILTSAACMGQGIGTTATHIVCQTLGIKPSLTVYERGNTQRTPDSGTSTASRQTLFMGEAARRAALKLKEALEAAGSLEALEGQLFTGEYLGKTDPMGSEKPNPVSHVAYGYATQVVILDEEGKMEKVVAAHDAGTVINPQSAEGQIEGGVVMGLGYGLTEDFPLADGYPTLKYGRLGLLRSTDVPPVEVIFVNSGHPAEMAYGAKGIGEICSVPTAPACQNAYYRLDGTFRTKLPLDGTFYRKPKK
ncbi:selenium-dependent xanthine dehydrogenase [Diplocloster agilis]|uniref:Selenium-dependent xanthine dehydrogenase n=1 Tax=Diplocloster agilis TaxID=2850323 RepID=A0A949JXI1_9FIRM|nr:selenium-dependent xanthine dehydrogenase [Diplocloster agilis]MBU9737015.1 selenium-dependent xanthine dehydrogenase [Diplocloster agilis]